MILLVVNTKCPDPQAWTNENKSRTLPVSSCYSSSSWSLLAKAPSFWVRRRPDLGRPGGSCDSLLPTVYRPPQVSYASCRPACRATCGKPHFDRGGQLILHSASRELDSQGTSQLVQRFCRKGTADDKRLEMTGTRIDVIVSCNRGSSSFRAFARRSVVFWLIATTIRHGNTTYRPRNTLTGPNGAVRRRYVSLCPSTKADAKSRFDECRKSLPSSRTSVTPSITGWADFPPKSNLSPNADVYSGGQVSAELPSRTVPFSGCQCGRRANPRPKPETS
ncbi:hypothetical protein CDEST_09619 [Colletotrichum destructivum]|uniref:Uncharacterized protein n=1 Tax=Colletotrichum destructivum TaxID=34406 RepID=A0AAX4IMF6_9PEZI|nr:hypothetical protein CDEST_09619 [Colletotrichum destructivum]